MESLERAMAKTFKLSSAACFATILGNSPVPAMRPILSNFVISILLFKISYKRR